MLCPTAPEVVDVAERQRDNGRVLRSLVIAMPLVVSCSAQPAAAPPAPAQPQPSPTTRTVVISGAWSQGDGDRYVACVDVDETYAVPAALPTWRPSDIPSLDERDTPLPKPCAEQFPGRPELARCSKLLSDTTVADGIPYTRLMRMHHYDFAALASDLEMSTCLQHGYEWWSVSQDSREYRRARLEHTSRQLTRAAGAL